jgi:HEPN domain-containing protein
LLTWCKFSNKKGNEKKQVLINYWVKSSDYDFQAAEDLQKTEKFSHALFFGHLAVEKILKALFVKINEDYPPKTHNLMMLVKNIGLEIDETQLDLLIEVNTFNIEARYPDEKLEFYERCTALFAEQKMNEIKGIIKWLKEKL